PRGPRRRGGARPGRARRPRRSGELGAARRPWRPGGSVNRSRGRAGSVLAVVDRARWAGRPLYAAPISTGTSTALRRPYLHGDVAPGLDQTDRHHRELHGDADVPGRQVPPDAREPPGDVEKGGGGGEEDRDEPRRPAHRLRLGEDEEGREAQEADRAQHEQPPHLRVGGRAARVYGRSDDGEHEAAHLG